MAAGSACCRLIIVGGDVVGSFTPKGSAFLWVSKAQQPRAQGVVISHEYKAEDFQQRFAMQGTLDDTAFITVPTALQVRPVHHIRFAALITTTHSRRTSFPPTHNTRTNHTPQ